MPSVNPFQPNERRRGPQRDAQGQRLHRQNQEGAEVKAGDLLFELDPRSYQAQYDLAQAQVAVSAAQFKLADKDFQRAKDLVKRNAISQQEVDQGQPTGFSFALRYGRSFFPGYDPRRAFESLLLRQSLVWRFPSRRGRTPLPI
jgi:hypothetical protein